MLDNEFYNITFLIQHIYKKIFNDEIPKIINLNKRYEIFENYYNKCSLETNIEQNNELKQYYLESLQICDIYLYLIKYLNLNEKNLTNLIDKFQRFNLVKYELDLNKFNSLDNYLNDSLNEINNEFFEIEKKLINIQSKSHICNICNLNLANYYVLPCYHTAFCNKCFKDLQSKKFNYFYCYECSMKIEKIIQLK